MLASMVRSNPKGEIGFVAQPERVNVLLSRAREAMILIGNRDTLEACSKNKDGRVLWGRIFQLLGQAGQIFKGFPVQCQRHADAVADLCSPQEFADKCPQGRCARPCGEKLPCSHPCPLHCHDLARQPHDKIRCKAPLERICDKGHTVRFDCGDRNSIQADVCGKCQELERQRKKREEADRKKREAELEKQAAEVAQLDALRSEAARLEQAMKEAELSHARQLEAIRLRAQNEMQAQQLALQAKSQDEVSKTMADKLKADQALEVKKAQGELEQKLAEIKSKRDAAHAALARTQNKPAIPPPRLPPLGANARAPAADGPVHAGTGDPPGGLRFPGPPRSGNGASSSGAASVAPAPSSSHDPRASLAATSGSSGSRSHVPSVSSMPANLAPLLRGLKLLLKEPKYSDAAKFFESPAAASSPDAAYLALLCRLRTGETGEALLAEACNDGGMPDSAVACLVMALLSENAQRISDAQVYAQRFLESAPPTTASGTESLLQAWCADANRILQINPAAAASHAPVSPAAQVAAEWSHMRDVQGMHAMKLTSLDELIGMTGLVKVKRQMLDLVRKVVLQRQRGEDPAKERLNILFMGNPGTGHLFLTRAVLIRLA